MTTGKTIVLTRLTFVDKVMSLLFNILSSLVITFLPRGKCLLISWLQSPSAVILEPRKIKSATVSTVSQSICHEVMGPDAMILVFWMLVSLGEVKNHTGIVDCLGVGSHTLWYIIWYILTYLSPDSSVFWRTLIHQSFSWIDTVEYLS